MLSYLFFYFFFLFCVNIIVVVIFFLFVFFFFGIIVVVVVDFLLIPFFFFSVIIIAVVVLILILYYCHYCYSSSLLSFLSAAIVLRRFNACRCSFKRIAFVFACCVAVPDPMFSAVVFTGACKVCFKDTYVSSRGDTRCTPEAVFDLFPAIEQCVLGPFGRFEDLVMSLVSNAEERPVYRSPRITLCYVYWCISSPYLVACCVISR